MVEVARSRNGGARPKRRHKQGDAKRDREGTRKFGLGNIIEFLISQGHREADLLDSSLEKIRFYYRLASERREKDHCAAELSMMHALRNAQASLMDKRGLSHYKEMQRLLFDVIDGPKEQDAKANRAALVERLGAMGARVTTN